MSGEVSGVGGMLPMAVGDEIRLFDYSTISLD